MRGLDSRHHAARILQSVRAQLREVPRELRPEVTDHLHRALWHGTLAYKCQERAKARHAAAQAELGL